MTKLNKMTRLGRLGGVALLLFVTTSNCAITDWFFSGGNGCACDCLCTDILNPGGKETDVCADDVNQAHDCVNACPKKTVTGASICREEHEPAPGTPPPPTGCTVIPYDFCRTCDTMTRADGTDVIINDCINSEADARAMAQATGVNCTILDGLCE